MADQPELDDQLIAPLLARFLTGEVSPEEEAAVWRWRRSSHRHEAAYREFAELASLASRLPLDVPVSRGPTAAAIVRRARVRGAGGAGIRRRSVRWLAAAAVTALATATVLRMGARPDPAEFGVREVITAAAETATMELEDGTVIRLAPSSRLRAIERPNQREVLLEGRGFFAVAERDGMPFVIRTGAGEVTVLGTRLDVEARGRDLQLVVVEGHVALATEDVRHELRAGDLARVRDGQADSIVQIPDIDPFVAWTGEFLAFQSTPLRDAAREIERVYGIAIRIADDALADRLVTAWFREAALAEVVDVVCLAVAARCTVTDGVVEMRPERNRVQPAVLVQTDPQPIGPSTEGGR